MTYPNNVKVFWLEPTDRERRWLRRFSFGSKHECPNNTYGCEATMVELGEFDILYTKEGYIKGSDRDVPHSDPRWPKTCKHCSRAFDDKDEWQVHSKQLYVRPDTGERYTLRDAPVGACWDAWWVHHGEDHEAKQGCGWSIGPDGRCLVVKCPDGYDWHVDSRCSNCTLPDDNVHHCWVRTGRPEDGTLHVDKNGNTCAAGAGSIVTPNWHGFLHHGVLHT